MLQENKEVSDEKRKKGIQEIGNKIFDYYSLEIVEWWGEFPGWQLYCSPRDQLVHITIEDSSKKGISERKKMEMMDYSNLLNHTERSFSAVE